MNGGWDWAALVEYTVVIGLSRLYIWYLSRLRKYKRGFNYYYDGWKDGGWCRQCGNDWR